MAIPDAIIEATEKGMVGENLLCASVPSLERAATEKKGVLTRAEEAGKSGVGAGEERKGGVDGDAVHVRIKGVDG